MAPCGLSKLALLLSVFSCTAISFSTLCTPANISSNEKCGVRGILRREHHYNYADALPQIVDSPSDCAGLSFRHGGVSFRFNERSNLCQFSSFYHVNHTLIKSDNRSHNFFYDKLCWDCGNVHTQPYGAQLLDNGDFQENLLGPWKTPYDAGGYSAPARLVKGPNGQRFYKWRKDDQYDPDSLSQDFFTRDGEVYAIEFDYRALITNSLYDGDIEAGFSSNYDEDGLTIFWYTDQTRDFRHARAYLYGPSGDKFTELRLRLYPFRRGRSEMDVSLDNFQAFRVPKQPSLAQPENNSIINGDFETGQLTPWKTYQIGGSKHFTIYSSGNDSNYALRFSDTAKKLHYSPMLSQKVSTIPGRTYLFEFRFNFLVDNGIHSSLYLSFDYGSAAYFERNIRLKNTANQTISTLISPFSNTTEVGLSWSSEAEKSVDFLWDDFRLVEVAANKYFPAISST